MFPLRTQILKDIVTVIACSYLTQSGRISWEKDGLSPKSLMIFLVGFYGDGGFSPPPVFLCKVAYNECFFFCDAYHSSPLLFYFLHRPKTHTQRVNFFCNFLSYPDLVFVQQLGGKLTFDYFQIFFSKF